MKKIKHWSTMITLISMVFSFGLIGPAYGSSDVTTSLSRDAGGGGSAPIIKAKWEMNGPYSNLLGTDADTDAGAQFLPSMAWDTNIQYSICAIATDPDGISDVDGVYVDIYYPESVAFHPEDSSNPDQINGGTNNIFDYGLSGCGEQREDESRLTKLSKDDGYNLFCNKIRNDNNNLPSFYDQYDYNEICDADGELMKETAYVYCTDEQLIWEDPAGDYTVKVFALDKAGVFSNEFENNFEYLPVTSYEVDFASVDYGNVKLNTHKRISGDLNFVVNDNRPTVRNTGNTRMYLGITQDDMGFGTTNDVYNVRYDARVGNNEADWKNFYPYAHKWLEDILDLSETEEVDFSILVTKFPNQNATYSGGMTLDAKYANFRQCFE
jgi:hypothetical protein